MKLMIVKKSGLEDSTLVDYSGLNIKVSTTARLAIRRSDKYKTIDPMSNPEINSFLGGIFKNSGGEENSVHYFLLKGTTKENPTWIEIRNISNQALLDFGFSYFYSIVREDSIDIIGLYSDYKKPKKPRKIKIKK